MIESYNKGEPRNQFDKGEKNGNYIDELTGEKIIAINKFGKFRRCQYFVVTRIDECGSQQPTCNQFDPSATKNTIYASTQLETLYLPSQENRQS